MKLNKRGQGMSAMLALLIGAIILVTVLGVIFNFISTEATNVQSEPNETITWTSTTVAQNITLLNDDLTGTTQLINVSGENMLTATGCTVRAATGSVDCNATGSTTSYAIYTYFPNSYATSGTTRTLLNLLPVLAALAVLLFVFGFAAIKGK